MSTSTYSSEVIIKTLFTTDPPPDRPVSWTISAHTSQPDPDGSGGEVSTGNDSAYARQAVAFDPALVGGRYQAANDAEIAFPPSAAGAPYTVTHVVVWGEDGNSNESALAVLALEPPRVVQPSGVLRFPVGELIIDTIGE